MPSKYSKSKNSPLLTKSKHNSEFSLEPNPDFNWLDYKFTLLLFAFLVAFYFVLGFLFPGDFILRFPDEAVQLLGLNNYLVLNNFELHRLVTSMLIHGHIFHLAGNVLFFLIFSIRLEELRGWEAAFLVFFVSGLAGNVLTLLIIGPNPAFWSLGASGAVNGVFSANLVAMRKDYDKGILSALFFLIFFATFTIAGPNANFIAHAGGLIGGGVVMYMIEE